MSGELTTIPTIYVTSMGSSTERAIQVLKALQADRNVDVGGILDDAIDNLTTNASILYEAARGVTGLAMGEGEGDQEEQEPATMNREAVGEILHLYKSDAYGYWSMAYDDQGNHWFYGWRGTVHCARCGKVAPEYWERRGSVVRLCEVCVTVHDARNGQPAPPLPATPPPGDPDCPICKGSRIDQREGQEGQPCYLCPRPGRKQP